jgi:chain length determinant protein (polysaccharide antigen chain regulator)
MSGNNELELNKGNYSNDDEIDLFDLIDDIWSHKTWVFLVLLVTVSAAAFYVYKQTPIYQAEVVIKPVTDNELIEFSKPQFQVKVKQSNENKNDIKQEVLSGETAPFFEMTVDSAFEYVQMSVTSPDYLQSFYELNLNEIKALPSAYNENLTPLQNFSRFSRHFSFTHPNKQSDDSFVTVALTLSDAHLASNLLNKFAEYALARSVDDSYGYMNAKVEERIQSLNYQAELMREKYHGDKARRILELKEAYKIAIAVGQENPIYRNMDFISAQLPPLYMLGSKAIKGEIEALESRAALAEKLPRGEDHFIKNLPQLLVEIDALKMVTVDVKKIRLGRIERVSSVPANPVKPRAMLIMAVAVVLGLFIGLFLALIVAAYGKHRARARS